MILVRRDIVAFYKQTVLGPLWFFIQPLFTMSVYIFVFSNLAGLSTDGLPPTLFYLTGITFWTYFAQTLTKTAGTLVSNSAIMGKVYFPRVIMPLSTSLSNFFRLAIQFLLLIAIAVYLVIDGSFEWQIGWNLLLVPVFVLMLSLQSLGFGMIISALTTKYRDMALLLNFGIQLLMYATPVVYPLKELGGKMYLLVSLNPVTYIFEGFRFALFQAGYFSLNTFLISIGVTFIILLSGLVIFNTVERNFVDTI